MFMLLLLVERLVYKKVLKYYHIAMVEGFNQGTQSEIVMKLFKNQVYHETTI